MTPSEESWYYASANGVPQGPISIGELGSLAAQGIVEAKTLVWSKGYPDWIPAGDIADLLREARAAAPPVPDPGPEPMPVAATAYPSTPPEELRPQKIPFVVPRITLGLMASGVIGAVSEGVFSIGEISTSPGLAVFAAGSVVSVVRSFVALRKERYQIADSRVICHRGGLLSDQTTELDVRNITHVKLKLPWLRYKFFGVGNVVVETAGTSKPVVMRDIPEPEAVYAGLRDRMKKNGYDLTQSQLFHQEKPALIGIVGECSGLLFGAAMAGLFALSGPAEELDASSPPVPELALPALLLACGLLAAVILRFLDYRGRTYRVYNDVVVYDEGFLTRHNAFIPYENIADANTKCSLFDRIFGLYDVQISCQGSSSEIKFRRLRNAVALSAAIHHLVVLARGKQKLAARAKVGDTALTPENRPRRAVPEAIPLGETQVGEFRMDAARTLVPLLCLLPLLPLWIAAMIQAGILLTFTRYFIRPGSLRHSYRFLTVHDREFACDKITGLVISESFWDQIFGTMTLRFWSIGSGRSLEFAHVRAKSLNLPALMRQVGIPSASPEPFEARARFGFLIWARSGLKYLPYVLLFATGIILAATQVDVRIYYLLALPVLVGIVACIHAKFYYPRQRLRFHDHHIEAEQGIVVRRRYFVPYNNIKRCEITRYPGGGEGELEIFVAAEEEVPATFHFEKNSKTGVKQASFTTGFLPDVRAHGLLLDDILGGRVRPAPQAVAAETPAVLLEASRSVGNALFKLVLLSIVIYPMIVLLPLTIPITVIRMKRWRYRIEATRVVVSWGTLYRCETSILLDRVDSLQQSQGPLNKLFRNGDVSIMTAGSSKPDLRILDSPGYLRLHQIIRERSQ